MVSVEEIERKSIRRAFVVFFMSTVLFYLLFFYLSDVNVQQSYVYLLASLSISIQVGFSAFFVFRQKLLEDGEKEEAQRLLYTNTKGVYPPPLILKKEIKT